jgi:hypothetical protein
VKQPNQEAPLRRSAFHRARVKTQDRTCVAEYFSIVASHGGADARADRGCGVSVTNFCARSCQIHVFTQVRRETGGKERVQVPYDEGRANHIGPESCVSDREVWGEALTGEAVGQVLSHVTKQVRDADAFCVAEGNTVGCAIASATPVPRGRRPWHVAETSCTGTGRSHDWSRPSWPWSALGRPEGRSQ